MELLSTEYKNVSPWKSSTIVDKMGWVCKHKIVTWNRTIYKSSNVPTCTTHSRCFAQINDRINEEMAAHPEYADDVRFKSKNPIYRELFYMPLWNFGKQYRECSSFYVKITGCTET
jgi:hypothetical protein